MLAVNVHSDFEAPKAYDRWFTWDILNNFYTELMFPENKKKKPVMCIWKLLLEND